MIPGTRLVIPSITLMVAMTGLVSGADKRFVPGAANTYAHQTSEQITIGAKPFDNEELTAEAFGKADLLKYGVLPVLVVIENKRPKALDLQALEVSLVSSDGRHVTAVNPDDIPFLASGGKRPSGVPYPIPLPKKKNPLATAEISTRAFAAKMVPPGESASGFFYFEARPETGDSIYIDGLRDARSGGEIMYFEFPFDKEPVR